MTKKRKICIVTGTRAEYGLLFWLMKEIANDPELELQIITTGMHLSPEFGLTYKTIEKDGFHIDEKVEMLLSSDTPVGVSKSIGLGVIGFADALDRMKPDIMVVLGDRFELLAATQVAMIARIPVAHIHGGETTEGAFDEAIRHAITKMSHFHFTTAEPYRKRVIQLGESPQRVFNFGAPGLDNLLRLELMEKEAFEKKIDFQLGNLSFLITYHPVTLGNEDPHETLESLFSAIDQFPDARVIFTKSNADTAGRGINKLIDAYKSKNPHKVKVFTSMGQLLYLSAIKNTDIVIGNSSSGIIEAPSFRKPTVNIGKRQQGRLRALSIIDCNENEKGIASAIKKGISTEFSNKIKDVINPYGQGNASLEIKEYLKTISLIPLNNILMKKFYNLDNE